MTFICPHEENLIGTPLFPKTLSDAKKNKRDKSFDEYIAENGIKDDSVCWIMGYCCPVGIENCEAILSFEDIGYRISSFLSIMKNFKEICFYFMEQFCLIIKHTVSGLGISTLESILTGEKTRFSSMIIAEISKRKGEIARWDLSPSEFGFVLQMFPVNDGGVVSVAFDFS